MADKEKYYVTADDMDRNERLYDVTDKKYQDNCIAYMYGIPISDVEQMRTQISEVDVANACDYTSVRGLPYYQRQAKYKQLQEERAVIAEEYNLSPIDAIAKRDELKMAQIMEARKPEAMQKNDYEPDKQAPIDTSENQQSLDEHIIQNDYEPAPSFADAVGTIPMSDEKLDTGLLQ